MKTRNMAFAGLIASQLGCGKIEKEFIIPLILENQVQSGDYFLTTYTAVLSNKIVETLQYSSTILDLNTPYLRSRVLLGDEIFQIGTVHQPIRSLRQNSTIQLQILTYISPTPTEYLTYINLREAP